MSVTYTAKAVIGLRIPKEKLYTEQPFVHIHGESSGQGNLYCSRCGEKLPDEGQTRWVPVWTEDDNEEPVIAGYPLLLDPVSTSRRHRTHHNFSGAFVEWAIMPALVATDDEYWSHVDKNRNVNFIGLLDIDIKEEARMMRVRLENSVMSPLWDHNEFGMFAILKAG